MAQNDLVSSEQFELTVQVLSLQIKKLQELLTMALGIMVKNSVLSEPALLEILHASGRTETLPHLKESLEKLQGYEAIHSILKDFEGPVQ